MRTTPSRRTTLQFLQIFFTDARTFMLFQTRFGRPLAHPIRNPAASQIVRRQFYGDLVAGQNFYVMHPHFARYMSQDFVPIVERHPEHRIGERFLNRSLYFDRVALRHLPIRSEFPVRWR